MWSLIGHLPTLTESTCSRLMRTHELVRNLSFSRSIEVGRYGAIKQRPSARPKACGIVFTHRPGHTVNKPLKQGNCGEERD